MAIDFTLSPDVIQVRARVREFMEREVAPAEERMPRRCGSPIATSSAVRSDGSTRRATGFELL